MNKLLERQVRKTFGDLAKVPQNLLPFLDIVSQAYDGFEDDRNLIERSLELSSQELTDINKRLREEAETQKAILESLRQATAVLKPTEGVSKEWLTTKKEAVELARDLTKLIAEEKQLERAKDEFVSIAAHQLRTPLDSMRWNMEMILRQGELPAQIRERLEHINQDNQKLITLVGDLLNISRIDQGRVENEPEPTDISKGIQMVVQKMSAEAQKQQVAIELQLDEHIPKITIDPKRFAEVIENLLSNAVKYNVAGGRVIVGVAPADPYIRISVADSGIGIPKEDQARVFSKFYRGENGVVTKATGSGLGLFIVKSYVDEWGGKVSFESPTFAQKTPDGKVEYKGTTFYIDLPTSVSPNPPK